MSSDYFYVEEGETVIKVKGSVEELKQSMAEQDNGGYDTFEEFLMANDMYIRDNIQEPETLTVDQLVNQRWL